MRLTLCLLGWTFDWTAEPTAAEAPTEPTEDAAASMDGGTTGSTPVGYTSSYGDQRWQPGADHGAGEPEDRAPGVGFT